MKWFTYAIIWISVTCAICYGVYKTGSAWSLWAFAFPFWLNIPSSNSNDKEKEYKKKKEDEE